MIGPNWSSARLADPGDRLRQELEAAMALGVEIIPVLVGGARMPAATICRHPSATSSGARRSG